jgi:uncharacterized protein (TIGR00251 family)
LRVRVKAPPVDGKANAALILLLSETFQIPKSSMSISHGLSSRNKTVDISLNDSELEQRINHHVGA